MRRLEETDRVKCECGRTIILYGKTVSIYCGDCGRWFDRRKEVEK